MITNGFAKGLPHKHIPLPAVYVINNDLSIQLVAADTGHDLGPDDPVQAADSNDPKRHHTVSVVRHALVDILVSLWWSIGSEDEEQVTEEEEYDDGEGGLDGRVPVPGFAVDVEVDETAGDKGVDDRERV